MSSVPHISNYQQDYFSLAMVTNNDAQVAGKFYS